MTRFVTDMDLGFHYSTELVCSQACAVIRFSRYVLLGQFTEQMHHHGAV
jgi:hypothetical protein